jgi:hypothetical protein
MTINVGYSGLKHMGIFALSLLIFIAWNVRPTFIVLVLSVPIAIFLLRLMKLAKFSNGRILLLTSMIIIPMLFFVAIRYQLTGHLGITSFNGFGLSSHATTHLRNDDLEFFDSSTHELAKEIYNRKKKFRIWEWQ